MIRGINRQDIFETPEDYRKFIETLDMPMTERYGCIDIDERRVIPDVRPRQLSRVTGMNYETIRNIAKKMS